MERILRRAPPRAQIHGSGGVRCSGRDGSHVSPVRSARFDRLEYPGLL